MIVALARWLIRVYQLTLSPYVGMHCRYYPSCSEYARIALEQHGPVVGLGLAIRRIIRCQPWGSCGFDPVPAKRTTDFNG